MRAGLIVSLALIGLWLAGAASGLDDASLQLLGLPAAISLVAFGLTVTAGGHCPRCGRRLAPRPGLRLPTRCPSCGAEYGDR